MNALAQILIDQGRKKQWLAATTGVSIKTISRYLKGETTPSSQWRDAAARALGCDPEDLIDANDQAPTPQQDMVADAT